MPKGQIPWMKGRHHTPEAKKRIAAFMSTRGFSDETRKKISETLKGQPFTEERRMNISNARKGKRASEETKRKISEAHTGMKRSSAACKKMSDVAIGRVRSAETRRRMSIAKLKLFQDQDYVRKMAKAWGMKPTKPEILLLNLIESLYPGQWKYTGDFSFTINGKCPDFVNCNGQKKIIELFGDYWHRGENPQDRADVFKPFGYETLVIWEHELKNIENVTEKVRLFHIS